MDNKLSVQGVLNELARMGKELNHKVEILEPSLNKYDQQSARIIKNQILPPIRNAYKSIRDGIDPVKVLESLRPYLNDPDQKLIDKIARASVGLQPDANSQVINDEIQPICTCERCGARIEGEPHIETVWQNGSSHDGKFCNPDHAFAYQCSAEG